MAEQAVKEAPLDIAALIKAAISEAVKPLLAEIDTLKAGQTRFVKVPPTQRRSRRTYEPPEALQAQAVKLHKGESANGTARWFDTARGMEQLPEEYRPIFRPGDLVRLNLEAKAWGDSRTWGEILAGRTVNPQGLGEIVCTMGKTETWEFKYKVNIPGESNGNGNGYRESELLFYDPDAGE